MKRLSMFILSVVFIASLYPVLGLAAEPTVFKLGFMSSLSGTFASVAETQKKGTLLAVEQINAKGGLNMPWGKVKVETIVKDDENKLDIGVRRYRELLGEGINAMTGTVWNPIAAALNEESKLSNIPYLAACVPAYESFMKGNPSEGNFSVAFTPWTIGYLSGQAVTKTLNKKKIFYLSRSDSWGSSIYDGLKASCKEYGCEIIGFEELPRGTVDYTAVINKAIAAKPDVFMAAQFAGDAIACFKQAYELGLPKTCTMFNTFITNVVATGLPDEALNNLYALECYYYNLEGFEDADIAKMAKEYTEAHIKMFNEPPDAYGTIAYIAAQCLFQAVEKAGSFDGKKVAAALLGTHFKTLIGDAYFREDHEMVAKYLAFLVKGKAPAEKKDKWDVFKVEGYYGGESVLPPLKLLGY